MMLKRERSHNQKPRTSKLAPKFMQRTSLKGILSNYKLHLRCTLVLWLSWFALIHYYERTVVSQAMNKCAWSSWEKWPDGVEPYRVALLSDPQIMDDHSYPGRPRIINWLTRQVLDNYHRKNWVYMHATLDPKAVFFLGDLFDGGRNWERDYWVEEYERFNSIFNKRPNTLISQSLPGNHDIGFGNDLVKESLDRFSSYFGDPNSVITVGNHTFVLLDTISLSNTIDPTVAGVPKGFLKRFDINEQKYPRILLTHVPLWRNADQQPCGDKRESSRPIKLHQGVQYETLISADLTNSIFSQVQPSLVFSGDDHDYCRINHGYMANGISMKAEEITVKSCAMNMGINRPAIQLLSLYNPVETEEEEGGDSSTRSRSTYITDLCYLPDPYKSIKMYVLQAIVSLAVLIWMHFYPGSFEKKVTFRIQKLFNGKPQYVLPVSNKKDDSYMNNNSGRNLIHLTNAAEKCWAFCANTFLLFLMVVYSFSYHYKSI